MADEQAKKSEGKEGKGKPTNCLACNKVLRHKRWYYRNGLYYCTKRCWKKDREAKEKGKAEKEKAAVEAAEKAAQEAAEKAAKEKAEKAAQDAAQTAEQAAPPAAEPAQPANPEDAKPAS